MSNESPNLTTLSRARMVKWALANNVTAEHPNFDRCVHVVHENGSTMLLCYAFSLIDTENADMAWIFTRDLGFHVFTRATTRITELSKEFTLDEGPLSLDQVH